MPIRDELSDAFGPVDRRALTHVRDLFEETEPLVESTAFNDPVSPRRLAVHLTTGFDSPGRFDVRWSDRGFYSVHYTEDGLDWRFDFHPNPHSPQKHFHPPPDAPSQEAVASCIEVERPELVALAVVQRWRVALESGDPASVNEGRDPP